MNTQDIHGGYLQVMRRAEGVRGGHLQVALTFVAAALTIALLPALASAQGSDAWRERSFTPTPAGEWTGARLADGQPDVQGHWSNTCLLYTSPSPRD